VNIDSTNHDFIIEDLDEERVVVKENMVHLLKQKLEDVRLRSTLPSPPSPSQSIYHAVRPEREFTNPLFTLQRLKENLPPVDESGSE
jgi:TFIIH basal transcription factor complex TTD-A subunit